MTDSFLAKVTSFTASTKKGKVQPLVLMQDGKKTDALDAKAISGITPKVGDIVLVVAIRNNLDDKEISIYYDASWSNCRIVGIALSNDGKYYFTGNYKTQADEIIEFKIGSSPSSQKMLLGEDTVKLLKDLLDAILAATVMTPVGASSTVLNNATFESIKSRIDSLLSKGVKNN